MDALIERYGWELWRLTPQQPLPASVRVLDRYTLDWVLGQGGSAVVLGGVDEVLGRPVALKIWSPSGRGQVSHELRQAEIFRNEARVLAACFHPNICQVYDFGMWAETVPWLALEHLGSRRLRDILRAPRGPAAALELFRQAASGVQALHQAGFSRLDIKPENMVVDTAGVLKIVDIGSPGLDSQDEPDQRWSIGTPGYVAPEVFDPDADRMAPGVPADLFSLGIVLLELLTDVNPLTVRPELARELYKVAGILNELWFVDMTTAIRPPPGKGSRDQLRSFTRRYRQAVSPAVLAPHLASLPAGQRELIADLLSVDPARRPPDVAAVLARLAVRSEPTSVFISHATPDKERFVRPLAEQLRVRGFSVWLDEVDLLIGQPIWETIAQAVDQSDYVVAVLSQHSEGSSGMAEELRYAADGNLRRVKILPVVLDGLPPDRLPRQLRSRSFLRVDAMTETAIATAVDSIARSIDELAAA
ncbi:TIR domain-containing protein [Dactylosporangium sp. NPDC049525]|uniref:protein kinase domain-containing protein n=1 Tax=Dactylosporangium sp. NPDC049525 TaxID=3154730 RepID=UPI00343B5685